MPPWHRRVTIAGWCAGGVRQNAARAAARPRGGAQGGFIGKAPARCGRSPEARHAGLGAGARAGYDRRLDTVTADIGSTPYRRGTEAVTTARTRNPLGAQAPRGFESHPLRHLPLHSGGTPSPASGSHPLAAWCLGWLSGHSSQMILAPPADCELTLPAGHCAFCRNPHCHTTCQLDPSRPAGPTRRALWPRHNTCVARVGRPKGLSSRIGEGRALAGLDEPADVAECLSAATAMLRQRSSVAVSAGRWCPE